MKNLAATLLLVVSGIMGCLILTPSLALAQPQATAQQPATNPLAEILQQNVAFYEQAASVLADDFAEMPGLEDGDLLELERLQRERSTRLLIDMFLAEYRMLGQLMNLQAASKGKTSEIDLHLKLLIETTRDGVLHPLAITLTPLMDPYEMEARLEQVAIEEAERVAWRQGEAFSQVGKDLFWMRSRVDDPEDRATAARATVGYMEPPLNGLFAAAQVRDDTLLTDAASLQAKKMALACRSMAAVYPEHRLRIETLEGIILHSAQGGSTNLDLSILEQAVDKLAGVSLRFAVGEVIAISDQNNNPAARDAIRELLQDRELLELETKPYEVTDWLVDIARRINAPGTKIPAPPKKINHVRAHFFLSLEHLHALLARATEISEQHPDLPQSEINPVSPRVVLVDDRPTGQPVPTGIDTSSRNRLEVYDPELGHRVYLTDTLAKLQDPKLDRHIAALIAATSLGNSADAEEMDQYLRAVSEDMARQDVDALFGRRGPESVSIKGHISATTASVRELNEENRRLRAEGLIGFESWQEIIKARRGEKKPAREKVRAP